MLELGITDRTSDNKPLGYQRLDRRGNRELKNLSYHAWRTACKWTTGPNVIKAFYQQSRQRTGSVRHARLLRRAPATRSPRRIHAWVHLGQRGPAMTSFQVSASS